eukprot:m.155204 g.155204  ORF g.155204 m.155204 type:complete len:89 (+) comp14307_c0_seq6:4422-4688(+)
MLHTKTTRLQTTHVSMCSLHTKGINVLVCVSVSRRWVFAPILLITFSHFLRHALMHINTLTHTKQLTYDVHTTYDKARTQTGQHIRLE